MPINNNRTENFKICFSGNEKSGFNSKKDIYILQSRGADKFNLCQMRTQDLKNYTYFSEN